MTGSEAIELFELRYEFMSSQNAPGFTDDEILKHLNDAQYKFISQRAFGNNLYREGFEGTVKRTDDLEKLVKEAIISPSVSTSYTNIRKIILPSNYLYFVNCFVTLDTNKVFPAELIGQDKIKSFLKTEVNSPWIEAPYVFIKDGNVWIIYDSDDYSNVTNSIITYIQDPNEITIAEITSFNDAAVREIVRIAVDAAIADSVPEKVQVSNDQLNKTE